jgi:hypothetical protein
MLDVFTRKSPLQAAKELFHRTWKITTRTIVRNGPRSVSWVICADLAGTGQLPDTIVAGGVCDTEPQARAAITRRYEHWNAEGPSAMRVIGRWCW